MREIQATFSSQEKFATDRRHGVIEIDLCPCGTCHLRSHEPSRSTSNNGNFHRSSNHGVLSDSCRQSVVLNEPVAGPYMQARDGSSIGFVR